MSDDTPSPLRERVAEEIRVQLARRNISAAELARRTGYKQPYLSRRMVGEVSWDLDDLETIARALDVDVAALLPRKVDRLAYPARPARSAPRSTRLVLTSPHTAANPGTNSPPAAASRHMPPVGVRRPSIRIGHHGGVTR